MNPQFYKAASAPVGRQYNYIAKFLAYDEILACLREGFMLSHIYGRRNVGLTVLRSTLLRRYGVCGMSASLVVGRVEVGLFMFQDCAIGHVGRGTRI